MSPVPNGRKGCDGRNGGHDAEIRKTGRQRGAKIIVAYLHGKGGNRKQGSNDYPFGGNFNRIRNLMVKNGGLYLTPDFSDFGDKGKEKSRR